MSEIPITRLINALLKKGFERVQSHHIMLWLVAGGRRTAIHTWISHSMRKADRWLLGQIAKELHLSKRELLAVMDCKITGEQYVRLMIERRHVHL